MIRRGVKPGTDIFIILSLRCVDDVSPAVGTPPTKGQPDIFHLPVFSGECPRYPQWIVRGEPDPRPERGTDDQSGTQGTGPSPAMAGDRSSDTLFLFHARPFPLVPRAYRYRSGTLNAGSPALPRGRRPARPPWRDPDRPAASRAKRPHPDRVRRRAASRGTNSREAAVPCNCRSEATPGPSAVPGPIRPGARPDGSWATDPRQFLRDVLDGLQQLGKKDVRVQLAATWMALRRVSTSPAGDTRTGDETVGKRIVRNFRIR
jgi:hypothetical protein